MVKQTLQAKLDKKLNVFIVLNIIGIIGPILLTFLRTSSGIFGYTFDLTASTALLLPILFQR